MKRQKTVDFLKYLCVVSTAYNTRSKLESMTVQTRSSKWPLSFVTFFQASIFPNKSQTSFVSKCVRAPDGECSRMKHDRLVSVVVAEIVTSCFSVTLLLRQARASRRTKRISSLQRRMVPIHAHSIIACAILLHLVSLHLKSESAPFSFPRECQPAVRRVM